ncbi:MAG: hypothetical protein JSS62_00425 [Verrucomicrobia bacterium]|nr:hypothetical protein [Verrucomicrobiota bacterium]MBS0646599.1 hypothetical protein [Verrucomicrobiota bacterium]
MSTLPIPAGVVRQPSDCKNVLTNVSSASLLILLLIGTVGALGGFPSSGLGWMTAGLGGGGMVLSYLTKDKTKENKWMAKAELIAAFALVLLGILGGTSVISPVELGKGILGIFLVGAGVALARKSMPFGCCKKEIENEQ